jgi:hypothetical protein
MIKLLRRFFGLADHADVQLQLDKHEKTLRNHERRLEHLRRERELYGTHRREGSAG